MLVKLPEDERLTYILGSSCLNLSPLQAYDPLLCGFLNELSKTLRNSSDVTAYPDVVAFAYWCRKGNIELLRRKFEDGKVRLGRGLAFHITPSNIPVNFAFSWLFGLLSGNANVVRLPNKNYPQIRIICEAIEQVLESFPDIRDMTAFVSYAREDDITERFSALCDARIIWGGDETIRHIRKFTMKERAVELVFADRYSFGIFDAPWILELGEAEMSALAGSFYNDTYLMDQNACSTPHLICWHGGEADAKRAASKKFWRSVFQIAEKRYALEPIKVSDKYTDLFKISMLRNDIVNIELYGNSLYVMNIGAVPLNFNEHRGRFGLFYEYDLMELDEIAGCIDQKIQTLVYAGMDKKVLADWVIKNRFTGIDRIVPVGSSMDIGVYWDGYDIISQLSRCVTVQ